MVPGFKKFNVLPWCIKFNIPVHVPNFGYIINEIGIFEYSEARIVEDEKALRRMNNQIHNTEMMMNQMLDEFSRVQLVHSSIRDRLQEEKERISQIEEALRVGRLCKC